MSRAFRATASALALLSLAMLGWASFHPVYDRPSRTTDATLWTAGAIPVDGIVPSAGLVVALPDITTPPGGAVRVPDVAYLRRAYPALRRLTIEGDGIEDRDAAVLRGVAVTWRRPAVGSLRDPELVNVSFPRVIAVGERMRIQGRIRGLRAGEELTLVLEGPDGSKRTMILPPATDRDAAFEIASESAAVAPGAFAWKLRLGPKSEALIFGAVVSPPQHPRVLILQASPTVEGGRLQRWLVDSGTPVVSRTRVSADHFRFMSNNGNADEFDRIDSTILAKFDVVITHEPALAALSDTERVALETAVRDAGLGLLVIDDPAEKPPGTFFAPWQLRSVAVADEATERRLSRLRLSDGTELGEPAAVLPAEFVALRAARALARDPQERVLVAALRSGRGWLARSLVTDTWRWLQGGHPEHFATFWAHVLSHVAWTTTTEGHWAIDHDSGPIFEHEALKLSWSCAPDGALPAAQIQSIGGASGPPVSLELVRNPTEPTRAGAVFHPTRPGWHEAKILPNGPAFAFHVHAKNALPELRAERRRDTTARLAALGSESTSRTASVDVRSSPPFLSHWLWLALFVASVSALWWDQRKFFWR